MYIGTSSWKYEGWLGQIYTPERYQVQGKHDGRDFKSSCLHEYAQVFRTVGVDFSYYTFPDRATISAMCKQVPGDFQFAFKVTNHITVKRYPNLPHYGDQAGKPNDCFLDAALFRSGFLKPLELFREQVGLLMFEFSRFSKADYATGREFVQNLDKFLSALPTDWPYAVEVRNKTFLHPDYFEVLTKHHVTHVYNNWSAMPTVGEQMAIPGSVTNPRLTAARFMITPGRKYQQAVNCFEPYTHVQQPDPEARLAGARLIREGRATEGRRTFIFVNNRLEGNAPGTIAAMIQEAGRA